MLTDSCCRDHAKTYSLVQVVAGEIFGDLGVWLGQGLAIPQ